MITVAILCGGRGARIQDAGADPIVKPLVEVGGVPIVRHVMGIYAAHGMRRFVLLTGWAADRIVAAVAEFPEVRAGEWRVEFVDTGVDTPTGGRVRRAAGQLGDGTFALTYADGLADVDLAGELAFHREHGGQATMAVVRPHSPWGIAELADDDRVTGFREKPRVEGWINGGFFLMEPEALELIGEDDVLEREPLERLAAAGELHAFRHEGFWDCMDTFKDAQLLNELWDAGDPPWLAAPAAVVTGSAR